MSRSATIGFVADRQVLSEQAWAWLEPPHSGSTSNAPDDADDVKPSPFSSPDEPSTNRPVLASRPGETEVALHPCASSVTPRTHDGCSAAARRTTA